MDSKYTEVAEILRLGVMKPWVKWPPAKEKETRVVHDLELTSVGKSV